MRLTINLAARGRPELLKRTIETTLRNVRSVGTTLMVSVDADDEVTWAAARGFEPDIWLSVQEREDSLGGKYNRALAECPADAYLAMVDYAPHVTPGFDVAVCEAASLFPDGIGCVFNHLANDTFPQINAATARWAELAGGIYPEIYPYWFVDHHFDDLARMTDRFACADIEIDTSMRPGTQDKREPEFWATVFEAHVFERRAVALRIIAAMDAPDWHKAVLRSRLCLVEERSLSLNRQVKRMAATDFTADKRYLRIRERALVKVQEIARGLEAA